MTRAVRQFFVMAAAGLMAAGCVTRPPPPPPQPPPNAGIYKIGIPYQIKGVWYYPKEQPDYDETGIASWYGPNFHGKFTANGEIFDSGELTAAHTTLPMPVNVRVTNLENGRTLVLRINDRGPFVPGRIIDVSEQASRLLGFHDQGTARVRVEFVGRADLPDGKPQPFGAGSSPEETAVSAAPKAKIESGALPDIPGARVSTEAPPSVKPLPAPAPDATPAVKPDGKVTQVPVPATTHLYVQVGAFSDYANARRLAARLGTEFRVSTVQRGGQTFYRVRSGPHATVAEADGALAQATAAGSPDAQIVVDQ